MTQNNELDTLILQHKGIVRTSHVTNAGISKTCFYKYVKEHGLQKAAHGIYLSEDAWADPMYILALRFKNAVFSHETALFLNSLTDREPSTFSVTVSSGYNTSKLKACGVKVYTIKKQLMKLGRIQLPTPFGYPVPVYNPERTICDIVRSRKTIEYQSFRDALRQYSKLETKNVSLLMRYSKAFHVDKIVKQYLKVLL